MDPSASASDRRLTRVLPRPTFGQSMDGPGSVPSRRARGRGKQTTAACESCRKRKSKCTGERPECKACARRGIECHYDTAAPNETRGQALKRTYESLLGRGTPHQELVSLLRTASEEESREILRRIREGGDVATILRQVKDGDLLLQLSLIPETRRRYDFPYIAEMPSYLKVAGNPYLNALIYEGNVIRPSIPNATHLRNGDEMMMDDFNKKYFMPYHAAKMFDPLLAKVTASRWTTVISDDELLRKLLNSYLLYQHPGHIIFHKDFFLSDMAHGRDRFCSRLLVNTILAAACQTYKGIPNRTQFWIPGNLIYQFIAEAKRLWELESEETRLTTIQAAVILNVISNLNGMDKFGVSYLTKALTMANKLGLFKASTYVGTDKSRAAYATTAWGLFNWQAMQGYYYFQQPFIKRPPKAPLPDPAIEPEWYGEIWLRYPRDQTLSASYLGHICRALSKFRSVLNDIASRCFTKTENRSPLSMDEALHFKSRLDGWYDGLPEPLAAKNIVLPNHFKLHLEYHATLVRLFQPLATGMNNIDQDPTGSSRRIVEQIVSTAKTHIETLLRVYYLRHSFEAYDSFLIYFFILLGYTTAESISTSEQQPGASLSPYAREAYRSTVILCAKGLYDQNRHIHVASLAYHAFRSRMKPGDQNLLKAYTTAEDMEERPWMGQPVQALWPIPIVKIGDDPGKARLATLIKEFEQMNVNTSSESSGESSRGW